MPIKKENRSRFCRVQNYAVGQRVAGRWNPIAGNLVLDAAGRGWNHEENRPQTYKEARFIADFNNDLEYETNVFMVIILTIAHLDHTPENNDPKNLRALCQKCHLKYDAKFHATNARRTLEAKRHSIQTSLFQ